MRLRPLAELGPLLVQLPPHFQLDLPRLEAFLDEVPREHRWTVELRHPSWQIPAVYDALGRRGVAVEGHAVRDALRLREMLGLAR